MVMGGGSEGSPAGASPVAMRTMPVLVQISTQSPRSPRTTAWARVGRHALNTSSHRPSHAVPRMRRVKHSMQKW